ncbi:MAG: hypothetical protein A4E48_02701 [Methanosaeta sp. PtaU1.Bin060]|jgi:hypothetical protein|nr:MAG: hypothetical protein A4E48_02701 [Methanosaeta sp. PtaU1.Bin060]
MNKKAFSIFVGVVMTLSMFAGYVLIGGQSNNVPVVATTDPLQTFGVQGRLVDWSFDSLSDVLEMAPNSTVMAYWVNLSVSPNLTDTASAVLPQSFALDYGSQIYPVEIERAAAVYFNNTWTEFHWIKPFRVGYSGLVLPYENFMMIPSSSGYASVMGTPTLFGPQDSVESVLDVIVGAMSTDKFSLPIGEEADLQLAALGADGSADYKEFYLGVSKSKAKAQDSFNITAKYLLAGSSTEQKAKEVAGKYGLAYSTDGSVAEVSGSVAAGDLQRALTAILGP